MACAILKKREEDRVLAGHPWIYSNEVARIEGNCADGDIISIRSATGVFLGQGFFNGRSKIMIRVLTHREEPVNEEYLRGAIEKSWQRRVQAGLADQSCRVVFAEADGLPGLVVDKFSDVLVIQTLCLGMDQRKELIVDTLRQLLHPVAVWERNDVPVREKEGLPEQKGLLFGQSEGIVPISENGVKLLVDVNNGQKTGYFLDQRCNRAALAPYVSNKRVLDCFSHTGSFALHAAKFGAAEVIAADISEHAAAFIQRNAQSNGFSNIHPVCANVFDLLVSYEKAGERFDVVILDPPAFCKSRAALEGAWRGYKEINLRAMKLLQEGGILITCSCSQHMLPEYFDAMLAQAAGDCRKTVRLLEHRFQSEDHPILLNFPESRYLKCNILQMMD